VFRHGLMQAALIPDFRVSPERPEIAYPSKHFGRSHG